jgi:hypothetical protein
VEIIYRYDCDAVSSSSALLAGDMVCGSKWRVVIIQGLGHVRYSIMEISPDLPMLCVTLYVRFDVGYILMILQGSRAHQAVRENAKGSETRAGLGPVIEHAII